MSTNKLDVPTVLSYLKQLFLTGAPLLTKPATDADLEKGYHQSPSISDKLPWLGIVGNDDAVLLEDAYSVAAVIDIKPISTEARSMEYFIARRNALQRAITASFPGHKSTPWVIQTFAFPDKAEFLTLPEHLRRYAKQRQARHESADHPYTDWFIDKIFAPHIEDMSAPQGLFMDDSSGNDLPWGGNQRKVYMVVYRRLTRGTALKKRRTPESELDTVVRKFLLNLNGAGVRASRLKGEAIRNWLLRWFHPAPHVTDGDVEAYIKRNPYQETEDNETEEFLPFDYSLADDVVSSNTRADAASQCWYFDGIPHTVLQVERLTQFPPIGALSAEREQGDKTLCILDQLPSEAVINITTVIQPRSETKRNLDILEKQSRAQTAEAAATRSAIAHAREQLINGNDVYPYSLTVSLRATDEIELEQQMEEVASVLGTCNLDVIDPDNDLYRLDNYLRHIPMSYDFRLDRIKRRNRLIYAQHLASLLPVYGRETGTGNPGLTFFNRGGEPQLCDPLSLEDRARNAHLFLYGPTGAGKSATLIYLQMLLMAIYRPRIVSMEAGNSFDMLVQVFADNGLSTVDISLSPGQAPSLAPYQPAMELVDDAGQIIDTSRANEADTDDESADADSPDQPVARDIMGELLIIAQIMVTGCLPKEEERFSRQDGAMLKEAILNAAVTARRQGKDSLITEDVIHALDAIKAERPTKTERIEEMVDAMRLFTDGFAGELFNRPGEELPDADFIRIDLGTLASGNDTRDKLSAAYISIINQVIARAKRTKKDGRDTIVLTDEAHVITTEPLLAKYLVTLAKLLGRRDAVWLWMATQNMEDFPDDAAKILSMFEWWLVLFANAKELQELEKFKTLTPDQRKLILGTKKVPRKYTEGVILSDKVNALFRNVPPAPCLILAGTEKEEKRERYLVMQREGCTEVEAAFMLADEMREKRRQSVLEQR